MQRKNTVIIAKLWPLLLVVAFGVALAGCTQMQQQKTWQRVAAEKAFERLQSMKEDQERGLARDFIGALISLEKGGSPDMKFHGKTLLTMAVLRGDKDIVERLISLDVYADVNCIDDNCNTPLILACERADVDIVKMLVDSGAQVNLQNKDGMTALMACARSGNKSIAGALMSAGANIRIQDKRGNMVGDYAKSGGRADLISYIANFQSKEGDE